MTGKWKKINRGGLMFGNRLPTRNMKGKSSVFKSVHVLVNYVGRDNWKFMKCVWAEINNWIIWFHLRYRLYQVLFIKKNRIDLTDEDWVHSRELEINSKYLTDFFSYQVDGLARPLLYLGGVVLATSTTIIQPLIICTHNKIVNDYQTFFCYDL